MKDDQHGISNATGESSSPFLEASQLKGVEIIYMIVPIEAFVVQQLQESSGQRLKSIGCVAEICRYTTSKSGDETISFNDYISFDEYISRMKKGQKVNDSTEGWV